MEERTVSQIFINRAQQHKTKCRFKAFQGGAWRDITWAEYYEAAREIALGVRSLGIKPGDMVCILSNSRLEWIYADTALFTIGVIPVPIYATLPHDQAGYILKHCEARAIFVEDAAALEKVRQQWSNLPALQHAILFDESGASLSQGAAREMGLGRLRELGRAYLKDHPTEFEELAAAVKPTDTFTIIYTSGTTGVPKGVVTTHANYVAIIGMSTERARLEPGDMNLLFLPLAHAYARLEHLATMSLAVPTGIARSLTTVVEDLQAVRPTALFSVPRVYEKAYARILAKAEDSPPLKRKIFHWSLKVGREMSRTLQAREPVPMGLKIRYGLAQRLVFRKVRALLGGRLRVAVTGASAISREILEFFHACGLIILEGYGMTETSTVSHINPLDAFRFGTVGPPLSGVEQHIAEDGEILMRGPNIMQGYYKMPEETAETLKDGWLHTGDIGVIDADGYLKITDRKKDLFKTSGGKYIAPSPIENSLKADPRISQALVHGDRRNYCVALITLNKEEVQQWAKSKGLDGANWPVLVKSDEVKRMVQEIVDKVNAQLASFETIKIFSILEEDFTIESGELTPSLKLKRKLVEQRCANLLDGMYQEVYR